MRRAFCAVGVVLSVIGIWLGGNPAARPAGALLSSVVPITLPSFSSPGAGLAMIAAGTLLAALALRRRHTRPSVTLPAPAWRPHLTALLSGIVAILVYLALMSRVSSGTEGSASLWLLATTVVLVGVAIEKMDRTPRHRSPIARGDIFMAVGVGCVSLVLNGMGITRWQFTWIGDELAFIDAAADLARGGTVNPFDLSYVYATHPALDSLYQSVFLRLLGIGLWQWRLSQVVVVAMVAAIVALIGRLLFGRRAGALSGLMIAVSHYLMAFSRIGYNNLHMLFWSSLAALFLVLAWRARRAVYTWACGCALGACLYTFMPALVMGLVLATTLLPLLLRRPSRRQLLAGAVLVAGFSAVVAPGLMSSSMVEVGNIALHNSRREAAVDAPVHVATQALLRSSEILALDLGVAHHYVSSPLLDPVTAVSAGVGLWLGILGWRHQRRRLVPIWFGLALVVTAGTFYQPEPPFTRLMLLIPPVALAAGHAGESALRLWSAGTLRAERVSLILALGIIIGAAGWNLDRLHRVSPLRHPPNHIRLASQLMSLNPDDYVLLVTRLDDPHVARWLELVPKNRGRFRCTVLSAVHPPLVPEGPNLQIPIVWTADPEVARELETLLGHTYRHLPSRFDESGFVSHVFVPAVPRPLSEQAPVLVQDIHVRSSFGSRTYPRDADIDRGGRIHVACEGDGVVRTYSPDGRLIRTIGAGRSRERVNGLSSVTVGPSGVLSVLYHEPGRIWRFDADGRPLKPPVIDVGYRPRGVQTGPGGSLLVAVTGQSEVLMVGDDGEVSRVFPEQGGAGRIREPTDVLQTPDGRWVVLDAGNHRILVVGRDGDVNATWRTQYELPASESGRIALLPGGPLLISERRSESDGFVSMYDLDGTLRGRWTFPGLSSPLGIRTFSDRRVVVCFPDSERVRVYRFFSQPSAGAASKHSLDDHRAARFGEPRVEGREREVASAGQLAVGGVVG